MIGRVLRSADFERVLGCPSRARSAHFAVHHLAQAPSQPRWRGRRPADLSTGSSTDPGELSTADAPKPGTAVDDMPPVSPTGCWLGSVVPKRLARRAVTRNLVKRQIRAAFAAAAGGLPPGLWVVRLRAPIDRREFPSASSEALRRLLNAELARLVAKLTPPAPLTPPAAAAGAQG